MEHLEQYQDMVAIFVYEYYFNQLRCTSLLNEIDSYFKPSAVNVWIKLLNVTIVICLENLLNVYVSAQIDVLRYSDVHLFIIHEIDT